MRVPCVLSLTPLCIVRDWFSCSLFDSAHLLDLETLFGGPVILVGVVEARNCGPSLPTPFCVVTPLDCRGKEVAKDRATTMRDVPGPSPRWDEVFCFNKVCHAVVAAAAAAVVVSSSLRRNAHRLLCPTRALQSSEDGLALSSFKISLRNSVSRPIAFHNSTLVAETMVPLTDLFAGNEDRVSTPIAFVCASMLVLYT